MQQSLELERIKKLEARVLELEQQVRLLFETLSRLPRLEGFHAALNRAKTERAHANANAREQADES